MLDFLRQPNPEAARRGGHTRSAHIKATMYKGLLTRSECRTSAIGTGMHKIDHLCFGVMNTGKPCD
jgi:hypothetical protein